MEKVIEMKGITKVFPGVVANDKVDFDLEKGEIHVLLGENGAGKTTLMNVLYGLYQQEEGTIFVKGKEEKNHEPVKSDQPGHRHDSSTFYAGGYLYGDREHHPGQ